MPPKSLISISIVIHNQANIVCGLLEDLQKYCHESIEVILTLNMKESLPFCCNDFDFPIRLVVNKQQKGFAENHNAAFDLVESNFFCVMNPDIRLESDPYRFLVEQLNEDRVALTAPLVVNQYGYIEDSARRFPTILSILGKAFGIKGVFEYNLDSSRIAPDWVAGMFMLFSSSVFKKIGGFDEKYFLYYEDVDLCARLWGAGYKVTLCPLVSVVHDARRSSHRKLKYFTWHLLSMIRFFFSKTRWRKNIHG